MEVFRLQADQVRSMLSCSTKMYCLLEVSIVLTMQRTNYQQTEVRDHCSDRHSQDAILTTAVEVRLFWTQHSMVNRFDQTKTPARLPKLALGTTRSSHPMAASRTSKLTAWLIKTSSSNSYLHSNSSRNKVIVRLIPTQTTSNCPDRNRAIPPCCRDSSFWSNQVT